MLIAGLVRVNGSLTSLSLVENALGPDGAAAVVGAMRGHKCANLDLTTNEIGLGGAKRIAEILATTTSSGGGGMRLAASG